MADIYFDEKEDEKEINGSKAPVIFGIIAAVAVIIAIVLFIKLNNAPEEIVSAPVCVVYDGAYVVFGSYPQSEISGNEITEQIIKASYDKNDDAVVGDNTYRRIKQEDGSYRYFIYEPIRWKVLNDEDGKLLLLSENVIDSDYYENEEKKVCWEDSYLYDWLQEEFYNTAFSYDEKCGIVNGGNGNVFLLNSNEVDQYILIKGVFTSDDVYVFASDYAYAKGFAGGANYGDGYWYLRSTESKVLSMVAGASNGLACMEFNKNGTYNGDGIRPSIIIMYQ